MRLQPFDPMDNGGSTCPHLTQDRYYLESAMTRSRMFRAAKERKSPRDYTVLMKEPRFSIVRTFSGVSVTPTPPPEIHGTIHCWMAIFKPE